MGINLLLLALGRKARHTRLWTELDYMEYPSDSLARTAYVDASIIPTINGTPWTGAIKTVGVGKDFATLALAIADSNSSAEAALYLVDAGIYTDTIVASYDCYIKGMGTAYSDTVWRPTTLGGYSNWMAFEFHAKCFLENLVVDTSTTGASVQFPLYMAGGHAYTHYINKCLFKQGVSNGSAIHFGSVEGVGKTYVSNVYLWELSDGIAEIGYGWKENISLIKLSYSGTLTTYGTQGSTWIANDTHVDPYTGYGPGYGSDLINANITSTTPLYAEAVLKTQGYYSLKGVATTDALNNTLTRTISPTIDLSHHDQARLVLRSSRTGSNIKIGLHDSGGTTTEITPNILVANTFQSITWDLSEVVNEDKDAIDSIIITIVNADAENTFYIDDFRATT